MIDLRLTMWMGSRDAAAYLGYSRDWLEIRAIEWPLDNNPIPGRFRYKYNPENGDRRYYRPDLDAFQVSRIRQATRKAA